MCVCDVTPSTTTQQAFVIAKDTHLLKLKRFVNLIVVLAASDKMRPGEALIIAFNLSVLSNLASCCGCFGRQRKTKSYPGSNCDSNFSAIPDDEHSVEYFRIKEVLSDRAIEGRDDQINNFVILGVAYSIVEMLDFGMICSSLHQPFGL